MLPLPHGATPAIVFRRWPHIRLDVLAPSIARRRIVLLHWMLGMPRVPSVFGPRGHVATCPHHCAGQSYSEFVPAEHFTAANYRMALDAKAGA